jgi:hypothetical protein
LTDLGYVIVGIVRVRFTITIQLKNPPFVCSHTRQLRKRNRLFPSELSEANEEIQVLETQRLRPLKQYRNTLILVGHRQAELLIMVFMKVASVFGLLA